MLDPRFRWAIAVALSTGCTVSHDENPFGSGSATAATIASSAGTTGDEETGEASSGSGGSSTGSSGSEGGSSESTAADTTSTTTGEVSSSEGAVDPTGQPADGMYSMCTVPEDCGNLPIFCITNADATDGFCSETGCANAAADCDPVPGGTATPTCVGPLDIDGESEMACALSCVGGLMCPTGMACVNFTDLGMICM
jgi:hypothetical protein